MVRSGVLLVVAACGRVGFGTADSPGTPDDASSELAAPADAVDAPPNTGDGSMEVTVSFGEGAGATFSGVTRDTFISAETGESGFNYGGDDEVRLESDVNERALFRFDVTALPANVTLTSATLRLFTVQLPPAATAIAVHRVLEDWSEGSLSGSPGAASYVQRTTLLPWSLAGASSPTSSSADPLVTFTPTALGQVDVALPAAFVQGWKEVPSQNFGVILISTGGESTRFATRENVAAQRPMLIVRYVP